MLARPQSQSGPKTAKTGQYPSPITSRGSPARKLRGHVASTAWIYHVTIICTLSRTTWRHSIGGRFIPYMDIYREIKYMAWRISIIAMAICHLKIITELPLCHIMMNWLHTGGSSLYIMYIKSRVNCYKHHRNRLFECQKLAWFGQFSDNFKRAIIGKLAEFDQFLPFKRPIPGYTPPIIKCCMCICALIFIFKHFYFRILVMF